MIIKNKNKFAKTSLIFGILIVLSCYLVSAIAISGAYSNKRPLEAYPGEVKSITFVLQNMVGEDDVKFKANISQGSEIVSFVGSNTEYLVPVGSNNIPVKLNVEIPETDSIGKEYQVKIDFDPISKSKDTGMVQIASGLSRYFLVQVVEEPKKPEVVVKGMGVWVALIIAILIAIIATITALILFFKKDKKSTKK